MLNLKLELFNFRKNLELDTDSDILNIVESHYNNVDSASELRIINSLNDKLEPYRYNESVSNLLDTLKGDVKNYELTYNLKDLYKVIETKNQGGTVYRPALNTILNIINTDSNDDKMNKIVNELSSMHSWIPEVKYFITSLSKSPEQKVNYMSTGKTSSVYTIVEQVENGHVAYIHDSWFLLSENGVEKTLLETHISNTETLNTLRRLQQAMTVAQISESRIDFKISENLRIGASTKNIGEIYINDEKTEKESTLESIFQSPIIPIVNKQFFPLIKETIENIEKFIDLDIVRKVENISNPFLTNYIINYNKNIYSYRVDTRQGTNFYKYESAGDLITDVLNEMKIDVSFFYEDLLSDEVKIKRALEDKERMIKLSLDEIDDNIEKVKANVVAIGESEHLTMALDILNEEKNSKNNELLAIKEAIHQVTFKSRVN